MLCQAKKKKKDLNVCEKAIWAKAERKYFKIKIVLGLEW